MDFTFSALDFTCSVRRETKFNMAYNNHVDIPCWVYIIESVDLVRNRPKNFSQKGRKLSRTARKRRTQHRKRK